MISAEQFAEWTGSFRREVAGMLRRMTIGNTIGGGIWQAVGHVLFDIGIQETPDVELYPGVGIFARPPDGNGELIVAQIAGPNQKAAIAQRDEATRQKVADINPDETALYNSQARVYVKADGTVEIRAHNGAAVALPTMADFNGLITILNASGVGAATNVPLAVTNYQAAHLTWPDGTKKLKAQ